MSEFCAKMKKHAQKKYDPFGSLWHNVFLRLNQSIPFRDYISELDCYNQKCC